MGCHKDWADRSTFGFPRSGFWIVHVVGAIMLFLLGMRFAFRRVPFSIAAFRLLRMFLRR